MDNNRDPAMRLHGLECVDIRRAALGGRDCIRRRVATMNFQFTLFLGCDSFCLFWRNFTATNGSVFSVELYRVEFVEASRQARFGTGRELSSLENMANPLKRAVDW